MEPASDSQNYGFSYGYNLAGEMTRETYPSGKVVQSENDTAERLAGVKDQATQLFYAGAAATDATNRMQYSSHGAVRVMKLGNGKWEHTTYDPKRLQPWQIGLGVSSTDSSLLNLDYTYGTTNDNGNVLTQTTRILYSGFYDAALAFTARHKCCHSRPVGARIQIP